MDYEDRSEDGSPPGLTDRDLSASDFGYEGPALTIAQGLIDVLANTHLSGAAEPPLAPDGIPVGPPVRAELVAETQEAMEDEDEDDAKKQWLQQKQDACAAAHCLITVALAVTGGSRPRPRRGDR